jgi:maleylpyruvate isomerase
MKSEAFGQTYGCMSAHGAKGGPESVPPVVALRRVVESQARFDAAIEGLDDVAVRRPSQLRGWTAGHVLSHVARNADSHVRRSEAAAEGLTVEQYPGGRAGREAEIDAGASRPASDLLGDVRQSGAAVVECWSRMPERAWVNTVLDVAGREHPLSWLPGRRWQELEIHLVDLGIGISFLDWTDEFVEDRLDALRESLPGRLPVGVPGPPKGSLSEREELAWLFGRFDRADLPRLGPWE